MNTTELVMNTSGTSLTDLGITVGDSPTNLYVGDYSYYPYYNPPVQYIDRWYPIYYPMVDAVVREELEETRKELKALRKELKKARACKCEECGCKKK